MKAAAKLSHPNIVQLHDASQAPDGRLYMVMAHVEGITLREEIDTSRRIDLVSAVYYAIQLAEALGVAHKAGIWHRDVKPENAIVHEDGRLWLLDFGIAMVKNLQRGTGQRKESSEGLKPATSQLMGTLLYMAPELILDQEADHRSDLYSLGVVLFEMLTGQSPFGRRMATASETEIQAAHAYEAPLSMVKLVPELPDSIERVTARLLAKDPEERYAGVDALLPELRQVFRESAPPDHPIAKRQAQDRTEQARKRAFARKRLSSAVPESEPSESEPASPVEALPTSGKGGTEPMVVRRLPTHTAPLRSHAPLAPWGTEVEPEGRVTQELPVGYWHQERSPFPLAPASPREEPIERLPPSLRYLPPTPGASSPVRADVPRKPRASLALAIALLTGAIAVLAVVVVSVALRSTLHRDPIEAPASASAGLTPTASPTPLPEPTAPPSEMAEASAEAPVASSTAVAVASASPSARAIVVPSKPAPRAPKPKPPPRPEKEPGPLFTMPVEGKRLF